jgi:hypothetical protein
MTEKPRSEQAQDATDEDSFPASDPPSRTPATGPGRTGAARADSEDMRPKGTPTDDRHATETASARIHGHHPPEGRTD